MRIAAVVCALAVGLCGLVVSGATTVDAVNGVCNNNNGSYYFVGSLLQCQACPMHAFYSLNDKVCVCESGFALTASGLCQSCAAEQKAVSITSGSDGYKTCAPCGGSTSPAAVGFTNSIFNATSKSCSCPSGFTLVDAVGTALLGALMCAPCSSCSSCTFPYELSASGSCTCSSGYTMLPNDGLCVLSSTLLALFSGGTGAAYRITPRNMYNSGSAGPSTQSAVINDNIASSVYRCSTGNQTSCNLLANLCVLSLYDSSSSPCSLYRSLLLKETCRGLSCEVPSKLPWLYYLRSSSEILTDSSLVLSVQLNEALQFLLVEYSWNGTWIRNQRLVSQLSLCEEPSYTLAEFYKAGTNRAIACNVNLRWVMTTPETHFYELFIISKTGTLSPVPVLLDYSVADINPRSIFDDILQRGAAQNDLTPNPNGYRRRFYIYDTIGGVPVGSTTSRPEYVTVAKRIQLMLTIKSGTSSLYSPLLIIQYVSAATQGLFQATDASPSSSLSLRATNATAGDGTITFALLTRTSVDNSDTDRALMTTLIVVSVVCFFSAWVRTYGWMRRQQTLMLGADALGRFFLYLLNHIGNTYAIVVLITTWYMFVTYKYQYAIESAVPDHNSYIFAMLYTAVSCKGVVLLAKIVEQTNADVFVVDWERSKGQLLRENKMAPVGMWRSAFVINELNEMQCLRRWRPLLSMLIIVLFLDGLDYINVATNVPHATIVLEGTAVTNRILRIAICAFFWLVVCLVLHVIEFQIYYRFFVVHPLQAFVDLCSVSNVSVMILLEPQWGYYIHGESIHAHADVSIEEFQENLFLEAQGNLPTRGLGGQAHCQTFEVFIGPYMRQYLMVKYAELQREHHMQLGGAAGRPHLGHHRRVFEFLFGMPGMTRVHSPNAISIKQQLNVSFQSCVRAAEKLLLPKFGFHAWLDFPPNVMYMNGPFAGEGNMTGGKDLFFLDDVENYGYSLLYGIDLDLCLFYLLLFVSIDGSLLNVYAAMVITYAVDAVLVWYRGMEGQANLGRKTLLDDRFFV